jgi:hypothetical protein
VSKVFLGVMMIAAGSCLLNFIFANIEDYATALAIGRIMTSLTMIGNISFIYLVTFIPIDRPNSWLRTKFWLFVTLTMLLAVLILFLDYTLYHQSTGFMLEANSAYFVWSVVTLVALIIPLFIGVYIYLGATDKIVKRNSIIISIAILLPFLLGIVQLILARSNVTTIRTFLLGLFLTGIVLTATQFRHKIQVVAPVMEIKPKEPVVEEKAPLPKVYPVGGYCGLIKSKKSDPAYRMFVSEVKAGRNGLVITRVHPDQVREKYGLVKTPILWLSGQPGPERVDPASISILQHTIVDFLQKDQSSIILLDGLEYLMAENTMDKVLRFLYAVHDTVVVSSSKFIVPLDPDVTNLKELALIEKEFEVVEQVPLAAVEPQAAIT